MTQTGQDDQWLPLMSTAEFGRMIGQSARTVRRRCREGTLPALRIGNGHWRIDLNGPIPDQTTTQRGPNRAAGRIR